MGIRQLRPQGSFWAGEVRINSCLDAQIKLFNKISKALAEQHISREGVLVSLFK